jgi:hypothetical protein
MSLIRRSNTGKHLTPDVNIGNKLKGVRPLPIFPCLLRFRLNPLEKDARETGLGRFNMLQKEMLAGGENPAFPFDSC